IWPPSPLLADAKTAEDLPQQVIAGELARDLPQRQLRAPQFLGEQLDRARRRQDLRGLRDAGSCTLQRIKMAAPCRQRAGLASAVTAAALQMSAQEIKAAAALRASKNLRRIPPSLHPPPPPSVAI